jgi:hypothetical protein
MRIKDRNGRLERNLFIGVIDVLSPVLDRRNMRERRFVVSDASWNVNVDLTLSIVDHAPKSRAGQMLFPIRFTTRDSNLDASE